MDKKDYLNISKASDIKNPTERRIYRFFEMLPGLISFGTLIGVFVFSWLIPAWISIFVICFCFYYLLRIFYFSLHQIVGYLKVKEHMKRDWMAELKKLKAINPPAGGWKNIYHIVILPTYKEGGDIVREGIKALVQAEYPKEKMIIVLALEERAGEEYQYMAKAIEKEYASQFLAFVTIVHPANIAGELAGKGANLAYAGKEIKKMVDDLKVPYEQVLISTLDIDTKIYPQYFSCLTWYYLTAKNPERASYQPIPVYNNNIWTASFFARVVSTSNTFWQMIQQERAEKLTTYSSHAIPARVFFEVGYPANVVCDDSRIFWRAYLYYDGDYRVVPIYYLVSMDAVDAPNTFKAAINQYKQQRRWAWGCAEIPYTIFAFFNNEKISFWSKISHVYTMIDGYWSWATASLLLFVLGWLPIFLGGNKFNVSVLSFNLPILTGRVMTISLTGMMVSAVLSTMLLPPIPKGVNKFKRVTIFLQWIFLPVTLIIFGAFPALDAQVRLMFGQYMGFWVTEKRR